MTNATPTAQLSEAGLSIWLDDLSRNRLQTGSLQKLIDEKNVVGVTTNPSVFQATSREPADGQPNSGPGPKLLCDEACHYCLGPETD